MTNKFRFLAAVGAAAVLFSAASNAQAIFGYNWDINPSLSSIKFAIPDQSLTLDGQNVTVRIRNQNNNTWSTNVAPVDGTISTLYVDGQYVTFLPGQSNIFSLDTGSYRPNPAAWNGTGYGAPTNTTTAPGTYGGKIRALALGFITLDLAVFNFHDVFWDVGGTGSLVTNSFASSALSLALDSALLDVDGFYISVLGQINSQIVPDLLDEPVGPLSGSPSSGTTTVVPSGLLRTMTMTFSVPTTFDLDGTILNATVSGTIVATTTVPEPSTFMLTGLAAVPLALMARRRLRRRR